MRGLRMLNSPRARYEVDFTGTAGDEQAELTRITAALTPNFRILGELGRGGMGVVYLGVDVNLDREVAIKVLPSYLAREPEVRERFLREARTAAKLTHPNIVPVYRADEMGGVVFFVMRHIDGESLADKLSATGTLTPFEVTRLLKPVALALDYAHGRGVIHRDIKPENILLERDSENPVVTDFGIARLMEAAPQTATGMVLGTVLYMSPEQVMAERVDGRSDVYSLGVVGFKALTASLPFENRTATAVLVDRVTRDPPKIGSVAPDVPQVLADIIDRCLARDAEARFQSAGALASALDEAAHAIQPSSSTPRPVAKSNAMPTLVRSVEGMPVKSAGAPEILSEREANALWSRAAQLQAETGVQPALRTLPSSLEQATGSDRRSLTRGFRMSEVRAAAKEVGIPDAYLDRAQQELGLLPAGVAGTGAARSATSIVRAGPPRNNIWVGAPTSITYEVEVPREAKPDSFEVLVSIIQRELGDPGHVSTLGRTLTFALMHQQRRLQISIVPRNGRTTIRVDERLSPMIGGIFGGVVGGGGGGGGAGMAMPLAIAVTHSPILGFGAWGATALAAYLSARGIFRHIRSGREKTLVALVHQLADEIAGGR